MEPIERKEGTVTFRAVSRDVEGRKRASKAEVGTRNIDTLRHIEKKLTDKGIHRMDRHPTDGIGIGRPPPKSGHGGRFTWEGPDNLADNELYPAPPALDEGDPNYVDDEEGRILSGERGDMAGEVEVPKVEDAHLKCNWASFCHVPL